MKLLIEGCYNWSVVATLSGRGPAPVGRHSQVLRYDYFSSRGYSLELKANYLRNAINVALSVIPAQYVSLSSDDKSWISPKMKLLIQRRNDAFQRNAPEYRTYKEKMRKELRICKRNWVNKQLSSGRTLWNVTKILSNRNKISSFNGLIGECDNMTTDFVKKINVQFAGHYIQSTGLPD